MDNTLENKAKFFAHYLNQKVFNDGGGEYLYFLHSIFLNEMHEVYFLELTPISMISDKDLSNIGFSNIKKQKVSFDFNNYDYCWNSSCGNYGNLILKNFDYLRSKGYALPYNGLSVENQIEYGWIKLKSK